MHITPLSIAIANCLDHPPLIHPQCVGIYFDQASKYTNWSQGVLDQLKDVKAMLEFKITVQDEKDPNKVHIVQAYRAQHSFHRLPWSVAWY